MQDLLMVILDIAIDFKMPKQGIMGKLLLLLNSRT